MLEIIILLRLVLLTIYINSNSTTFNIWKFRYEIISPTLLLEKDKMNVLTIIQTFNTL